MINETEYVFVRDRFLKKFPNGDLEKAMAEYENCPAFAPSGNHVLSKEAHYVMRLTATYHMQRVFEAMRIDLSDPNVVEDLECGNIGTPGRIVKWMCGSEPGDDTELGGGRWSEMPRLATFPNTNFGMFQPITKRVDLTGSCSHHFIPFSTKFSDESHVVISYIPKNKVLGISKLQRLVNWVSQRFWLQEDLTKALYNEISKAAETEDVYIRLELVRHGCEFLRGANSDQGAFTSVFFRGRFTDPQIRALAVA